MFGIGPSELIIILIIALLVLGPKRLPELAAGLGKGLAEFRRATADINAELDDARRTLDEQSREASRATQDRRVSRTQRTNPALTPVEADKSAENEVDDPDEASPSDPKAPA